MSKYTTQLRYICESKAGLTESSTDFNSVIDASYDQILHPETTLFDPAYAPVLYKKIIRHYYFDEIAHETVGQFIMRINTKLDEILPYYNMFYQSAALTFNPLYDVDYTVEGNKEDNNTDNRTRTDNLQMERTDDLETLRTDNLQMERTDDLETLRTDNLQSQRTDNLSNHGESTAYELFSDTPEGSLSSVENENYLTTAKKTTSEADGTNTGTQTTADTGTQKTDNTGTQTVENTGTQKTDNTGTQTVENTGTQKTDNTGTQIIENTGTQTNNAIIHNINEYAEHVSGKRGGSSYSKMLQEFRDTFINIDMLIINELKDCFMGVY